jgi:PAS domain S-box-containing protein
MVGQTWLYCGTTRRANDSDPVSGRQSISAGNPMLQSEFEEHYAELTREISALEAELVNSEASKPFADVKRRVKILYEMLRENRLLLETVLENSAASIYAKRKDGRYTYMNRGMEDLCNVTREQALGRTDFEVFPREIAQQFRTNDLTTMETGKLTECEERVETRWGERLALSKKVPLISGSGEVEGICGISTDITDLRRTELALRDAVAKLERERDNKIMNIEAITASIAHEIRQPLTAISTNGSAARRFLGHAPPNLEEVRSAINRMISDSDRASQVFDNIRDLFGKANRGPEPIDVNKLADGVLQSLHEELKDHGITTHADLTSELPLVMGHKGQLQEVLFNLVNNAIEAMDPIKDDRRILQVRAEPHGSNSIILAVEDSGPGIDPKQANSIFDAFVTTKARGMGLGLAICKMIIERHDGQLSASPAHPRGSIFRVVLPAGRPSVAH